MTGQQFIGSKRSKEGKKSFRAIDPKNRRKLDVEFYEATDKEIDEAINLAQQAFLDYRNVSGEERAFFLECIADEILSLGDELIERCMLESALPRPRLEGERGRTMGQLRLFASVLKEGSWVDARIDLAQPKRSPIPKPDIRHMKRALGPVGIFGASNFPLAFSVAGGDTASALAAGCPVVVKAHPAHPGTSELVAKAILKAAKKSKMPEGVFSLVQGGSTRVGAAIVKHHLIKAIGFTGSFRGGKALFDLANTRKEPIPVFAEMGSTNPVFILPNALRDRGDEIAKGLAGSITLGGGQFCTNPGLTLMEGSQASEAFIDKLSFEISNVEVGSLLTEGIQNAYDAGIENLISKETVRLLAAGKADDSKTSVVPKILGSSALDLLEDQELSEEVFGPSSLLLTAESKEQLLVAARNLEGHLTATIFGDEEDLNDYRELFSILENKVGRLIVNNFPTGVEVCHSMVHGGPFPATTAPQTTSVGTNAINRFSRPVCFQNLPQRFLPAELKDENPLGIWRMVDGNLTKDKL